MIDTTSTLAARYRQAHDALRDGDGLQPTEALDELLKYLFLKERWERTGRALPPAGEPDAAQSLRRAFELCWQENRPGPADLWQSGQFDLSDSGLLALHRIFGDLHLDRIAFDLHSAALQEFLAPTARRGLGIFPTPQGIARLMVAVAAPTPHEWVYDPACGPGTLLAQALERWRQAGSEIPLRVWGTDKNPRMILLAGLALGNIPNGRFHGQVMDALFPHADWPRTGFYDVVLANPPFGVWLEASGSDLGRFRTCIRPDGYPVDRQPSEILFLEKCLDYLKPGGRMAVVMPRSAISNDRLHSARQALDGLGYVYAVVLLPREAFAASGTKISTACLFVRKYAAGEKPDQPVQIVLAEVDNVGYDGAGQARPGDQLPDLADHLRACLSGASNSGPCRRLPALSKSASFSGLNRLLATRVSSGSGLRLEDVAEYIGTGRTPSRQGYADSGLFVVKVGNLSQTGINWTVRERNFVDGTERQKREADERWMLRPGDILLTATAHSPAYIGKKVNIVQAIPQAVGGAASYVGEILVIRPAAGRIDPYVLLAFLCLPNTTRALQARVKGQTGHLYPKDIVDLPLPTALLRPDTSIQRAAGCLRRAAGLNLDLAECMAEQERTLAAIKLA